MFCETPDSFCTVDAGDESSPGTILPSGLVTLDVSMCDGVLSWMSVTDLLIKVNMLSSDPLNKRNQCRLPVVMHSTDE